MFSWCPCFLRGPTQVGPESHSLTPSPTRNASYGTVTVQQPTRNSLEWLRGYDSTIGPGGRKVLNPTPKVHCLIRTLLKTGQATLSLSDRKTVVLDPKLLDATHDTLSIRFQLGLFPKAGSARGTIVLKYEDKDGEPYYQVLSVKLGYPGDPPSIMHQYESQVSYFLKVAQAERDGSSISLHEVPSKRVWRLMHRPERHSAPPGDGDRKTLIDFLACARIRSHSSPPEVARHDEPV